MLYLLLNSCTHFAHSPIFDLQALIISAYIITYGMYSWDRSICFSVKAPINNGLTLSEELCYIIPHIAKCEVCFCHIVVWQRGTSYVLNAHLAIPGPGVNREWLFKIRKSVNLSIVKQQWAICFDAWQYMMTSSNGNIFRVTGHLCGEFTGPRVWILIKISLKFVP